MIDFYISAINIAERRTVRVRHTVTNTNSDTSYYVLYVNKKNGPESSITVVVFVSNRAKNRFYRVNFYRKNKTSITTITITGRTSFLRPNITLYFKWHRVNVIFYPGSCVAIVKNVLKSAAARAHDPYSISATLCKSYYVCVRLHTIISLEREVSCSRARLLLAYENLLFFFLFLPLNSWIVYGRRVFDVCPLSVYVFNTVASKRFSIYSYGRQGRHEILGNRPIEFQSKPSF